MIEQNDLRNRIVLSKIVDTTFTDYTSCFENVDFLPEIIVPISISFDCPNSWKGLKFEKLYPNKKYFKEFQKSKDYFSFANDFTKNILFKLDPEKTWNELRDLTKGRSFALIGNGENNKFCHRHLVSKWFNDNGFFMKEFYKYSL